MAEWLWNQTASEWPLGDVKSAYDWSKSYWNWNPAATAWDAADVGNAYQAWRGANPNKPILDEYTVKQDFNKGYMRWWNEVVLPKLGMTAEEPGAQPAVEDYLNFELGGPGPVTIDGVDYKYATWKVFTDGHLELIKDYSKMLEDIQTLPDYYEEQGLSSFGDWQTKTGNYTTDIQDYLDAMEVIAGKLNDSTLAADLAAAKDYAAGGMGITSQEYADIMARLTNSLASDDLYTQKGFSQQELATRARMQRSQQRIQGAAFQKMLDNALGSSNSRAKYLMQADSYLTQMRDQELQFEFAQYEEERAIRQQNFDNQNKTWLGMLQQNQMSSEQYMSNLRQNRSMEMQIVAAQASTVLQNNQFILQQYTADLSAAEAYIQAEFNSIANQLGMDQSIYENLSNIYDIALAPYLADLAGWSAQQKAYADQQALLATYAVADATSAAADTNVLTSLINGAIQIGSFVLSLIFGANITTPSTPKTQESLPSTGYRDDDF